MMIDLADGDRKDSDSRILRVAVVSDLHSYSAADPKRAAGSRKMPSYLCADPSGPNNASDPITDLLNLVRDPNEHIKADILLCPGDLGDVASVAGIQFSWRRLGELASALEAKQLVGTPGNHDLNHDDHEADGVLKALNPMFPISDETLRNKFWTDGFAIVEGDHYRLLCLNSSAHHKGKECEQNHGRFSDRSRNALKLVLRKLPAKDIQIVLCHHHPHQHADYDLGEHDVMAQGQQLLDLLSKHGNWLVVHGHKHHPKLTHAAGGSRAPWVFAAGSMAVCPFAATPGHARNQFYVLEFRPDTFENIGWGGTVRAWDWATEDGWTKAGPSSGLPAEFSFGFLGDLRVLAQEILAQLPARAVGYKSWAELATAIPKLQRICPRDIEQLSNYGLSIEPDKHGVPYQVARQL